MLRSQNRGTRFDALFKTIDPSYQINEIAGKKIAYSMKVTLSSWTFLFEVLQPFKRT